MARKPTTFEDALERLQEIVQRLEEENLSLDESVALFKEGTQMYQLCRQKLKEAEGAIKALIEEGNKLTEKPLKIDLSDDPSP
ncbi:MAG: exodeoxyribonuclease VII small subunit [bacterium]